jgi:hypothetical protein
MPSIPAQKNWRSFLAWEHCDVMNKTSSRVFLKNAWKPLNFIHLIAPEKVCPSVEQNKIVIYRVLIKDEKYTGKWTCSTYGLYVFLKENLPNLCVFSTKLTFLQFYVNFITSLYSKKQLLDQTGCILCFLCISYLNAILTNSLIFGGQMTVETVSASLYFRVPFLFKKQLSIIWKKNHKLNLLWEIVA